LLETGKIIKKIKLFEFSPDLSGVARALGVPYTNLHNWMQYNRHQPPTRLMLSYIVPWCIDRDINIEHFLTKDIS